jgi:hypothetical protein
MSVFASGPVQVLIRIFCFCHGYFFFANDTPASTLLLFVVVGLAHHLQGHDCAAEALDGMSEAEKDFLLQLCGRKSGRTMLVKQAADIGEWVGNSHDEE